MDAKENDSFDKLLLALSSEGFSLPFMARISDHGREGIRAADEEAWQQNRDAVIKALTDSGWVAG